VFEVFPATSYITGRIGSSVEIFFPHMFLFLSIRSKVYFKGTYEPPLSWLSQLSLEMNTGAGGGGQFLKGV